MTKRARAMTFDQWKRLVALMVQQKTTMHPDELPDMDYYSWYEAGMSVLAATSRTIAQLRVW